MGISWGLKVFKTFGSTTNLNFTTIIAKKHDSL